MLAATFSADSHWYHRLVIYYPNGAHRNVTFSVFPVCLAWSHKFYHTITSRLEPQLWGVNSPYGHLCTYWFHVWRSPKEITQKGWCSPGWAGQHREPFWSWKHHLDPLKGTSERILLGTKLKNVKCSQPRGKQQVWRLIKQKFWITSQLPNSKGADPIGPWITPNFVWLAKCWGDLNVI